MLMIAKMSSRGSLQGSKNIKQRLPPFPKGANFSCVCRDSRIASRNVKSAASYGHWEFTGHLEYLADPKSDKGFCCFVFTQAHRPTCVILTQLFHSIYVLSTSDCVSFLGSWLNNSKHLAESEIKSFE